MRIVGCLVASFLISFAFLFAPQVAQARTYEQECRVAHGALKWDPVGLRWCCQKFECLDFKCRQSRKTVLWCKP